MGILSGRQWMSEEGVPEDTGKWGYADESGKRVSALRDMLDGGGRGRAGQRFEGGLLADLANALGFRPLGYQEQLAASRPMARPTRAAAPAAPNWAAAQGGMALEGQGQRFGDAALSFNGGAMPDWANFVGASPLAFGIPREIPSPRRVNMPTAPQGMFTSPLSLGGPSLPLVGGIYDSYMTGPDYTRATTASRLPVVIPTGGLPWVHNPLPPYSGNIRGTGTGGGGYGFPVVGTYTF